MDAERKLKAAVRARDGHCCVSCGMTAEEHRERYGKTLDVHRLVPGSPYTLAGCVTVCRACHQGGQHGGGSVRWAIWKRDELRCTNCGMTRVEHHKRFGERLDIHCLKTTRELKGRKIAKWVCRIGDYSWSVNDAVRYLGVTVDDCVTLCQACHADVHERLLLRRREYALPG